MEREIYWKDAFQKRSSVREKMRNNEMNILLEDERQSVVRDLWMSDGERRMGGHGWSDEVFSGWS